MTSGVNCDLRQNPISGGLYWPHLRTDLWRSDSCPLAGIRSAQTTCATAEAAHIAMEPFLQPIINPHTPNFLD